VLKQDYNSKTINHRRYTDDKIFNYSINEAEDIFAKSVDSYGKKLTCFKYELLE
jgi:hypothetical protein